MRIGVDGEDAAHLDGAPGTLHREVEPRRRAVHLERGPGPGRLGVDRVPVEVEVVALADLAARRMGDQVDVRTPDRVERPGRQLGARLAACDMDRGDDQVEAGQQVVLEIEPAVGADLELATVEEAETLGRRPGRCRPGCLLGREPGVERGDHLGLLGDPVRGQPVRDRERLRVVGQDLVRVASGAGGLGHDLDRVVAVGPVGMAVEVAAQVGQVDERREPAGDRGLDLAMILAQLGLDVGQPEEGVRVRFGRERPELGGRTRERLAVLADAQVALLRQAPAEVSGHRPEPDVVLFRPGEMDAVGAGLAGRHDHQVGLWSAHQPDGSLVAAPVDDRIDHAQRREGVDQDRRLVRLGQEVEVADRLLSAAERAGRLDRAHAGRSGQQVHQGGQDLLGIIEAHAVEPLIELGDPVEDERLGPARHPAQVADPAGLGGMPEVLDRLDAEIRVELPHGLRTEAGDPQQLDQARRDLGAQAVVVGHPAGRRQLADLVADGLADAGDGRRASGSIGRRRGRPGCARWHRRRDGRRRS